MSRTSSWEELFFLASWYCSSCAREGFSQFPVSPNKVGAIVTQDFEWCAIPGDESSQQERIHIKTCCQVQQLKVNAPGGQAFEQYFPPLLGSAVELHAEWAKTKHCSEV